MSQLTINSNEPSIFCVPTSVLIRMLIVLAIVSQIVTIVFQRNVTLYILTGSVVCIAYVYSFYAVSSRSEGSIKGGSIITTLLVIISIVASVVGTAITYSQEPRSSLDKTTTNNNGHSNDPSRNISWALVGATAGVNGALCIIILCFMRSFLRWINKSWTRPSITFNVASASFQSVVK